MIAATAVLVLAVLSLLVTSATAEHERAMEGDRQVGFFNSAFDAQEEIRSLPVNRLKRFIADRNADCDGCVEKFHLVQRALEVSSWPTRDDGIAAELSLEQDLVAPLIPSGDDRGMIYGDADSGVERTSESPSARASGPPLTDAQVAALLQLYQMRTLVQEGKARCGFRSGNGTVHCVPAQPVVTRESNTM